MEEYFLERPGSHIEGMSQVPGHIHEKHEAQHFLVKIPEL